MFLLGRFKISGHSMMPVLKPGRQILVSGLPYLFFAPKIGDMVAFKDGDEFIVKRVREVIGDRLQVAGDNKKDSKDYGWIDRKNVIGKVIYVYA
jgi:signal peptidase I